MSGKLIALYASSPQSGKSTVAQVLVQERGFRLVKLASPVKDFIKGLLIQGGATEPIAERMVEGDLKEQVIPGLGVSTRRLLQTLGTDWGRNVIHPDIWVTIAAARIKENLAAGYSVVVDDMRFPNEYQMVLNAGGTCVKVDRSGTEAYAAHASEGLLDDYPMTVLQNNSTVGELRACARELPELLGL
jgi:hypothetical protein